MRRNLIPWLIGLTGLVLFLTGCTVSAILVSDLPRDVDPGFVSWPFAWFAGSTLVLIGSLALAELASDFPRARRVR